MQCGPGVMHAAWKRACEETPTSLRSAGPLTPQLSCPPPPTTYTVTPPPPHATHILTPTHQPSPAPACPLPHCPAPPALTHPRPPLSLPPPRHAPAFTAPPRPRMTHPGPARSSCPGRRSGSRTRSRRRRRCRRLRSDTGSSRTGSPARRLPRDQKQEHLSVQTRASLANTQESLRYVSAQTRTACEHITQQRTLVIKTRTFVSENTRLAGEHTRKHNFEARIRTDMHRTQTHHATGDVSHQNKNTCWCGHASHLQTHNTACLFGKNRDPPSGV